jgi:hypothetical protein
MAIEKWNPGAISSFTTCFTSSTLNSIASGNAILSDLQIDNTSNLDIFCEVGIQLASAAFVAPNTIGIYVYPLNQDASTYGDGRFGTSAAGPPGGAYLVGSIPLVAATQAQEGVTGPFIIRPIKFKFVFYNIGGVALASSANNCYYRTYNRQLS